MKARKHEYRRRDTDARMHRRTRSIRALRCARGRCAGYAALTDRTTPAGLSQEGGSESEPARPEAEGQLFCFFGPRGRFLEGKRSLCRLRGFSSELLVHNPLADDSRHSQIEAIPVVHLAAIVVPEHVHPNTGTDGKARPKRRYLSGSASKDSRSFPIR